MLVQMLKYSWRSCALGLAITLAYSGPVFAVECDAVSEYSDMWAGNGESSFPLYGRGVADGGAPCQVTERTSMTSPSGTEIAAAIAEGSGYAESTVTVYIDENSEGGQYTTTAAAWSQGVYYGCATNLAVLTPIAARYVYNGEFQGRHQYIRYNCFHHCQDADIYTDSNVGAYLNVMGHFVNLGFASFCWGKRQGASSPGNCFGPP